MTYGKEELKLNAEDIVREFPKGLLNWCNIEKNKDILFFKWEDSIEEMFSGAQVVEIQKWEQAFFNEKKYDYIVAIETIEQLSNPTEFLSECYRHLDENGKLFLGCNNRLGVRYFCGERDPYVGRSYDGIEGYRRTGEQKPGIGRCYAKYEIEAMLTKIGVVNYKFYSVFPTLKQPQLIYADGYIPNEQMANRYRPVYDSRNTIILEEEYLCDDLAANGMLHSMANAYLVECVKQNEFMHVQSVSLSMNRVKEYAAKTVVRDDGYVEKSAIYDEGHKHIFEIKDFTEYLKKHGVPVQQVLYKNKSMCTPYIQGKSALIYLQELAKISKDDFLTEMDKLYQIIMNASDFIGEELIDEAVEKFWLGVDERNSRGELKIPQSVRKLHYVEKCPWDLAPVNAIVQNEKFVFFDQEFCIENTPIEIVVSRLIDIVCVPELEKYCSKQELIERYQLQNVKIYLEKFEQNFYEKITQKKVLGAYYNSVSRDNGQMNGNRERLNFSTSDYLRLFIHVFRGLSEKKVYLFGTGRFAQKFVATFGDELNITNVFDNDKSKWGKQWEGYCVQNPAELLDMDLDQCKVIVCMRNYLSVLQQLEQMRIKDIGIYDPGMDYPKENMLPLTVKNSCKMPEMEGKKKYHIGYVAGVFDLFHVGHLNLLHRAKELCDYLIVGIVTDEEVRKVKRAEPVIAFENRKQIVEACRYVDKVIALKDGFSDTAEVYQKYQFDVQFSGSDYESDAGWLAKQSYLRERGADLIFFPYTDSVSTTKLKEVLREGEM